MRKATLLVSMGTLLVISGCKNHSAPPLPALANLPNTHEVWSVKESKVSNSSVFELRKASLDGRFNLSVYLMADDFRDSSNEPLIELTSREYSDSGTDKAVYKLMGVRIRFDDGLEKHAEWQEYQYPTRGIDATLSSYTAMTSAPIGPIERDSSSTGGGKVLLKDMLARKAMLVEIEPGVSTQFDLSGLSRDFENLRTTKIQPLLEAEAAQKAADQAAEQAAEEAAPVLDSLNIDDVIDRCGQPDNTVTPSLEPYLTYSNAFNTGPVAGKEFSTVDIFFKGTTQGTHIDYPQVDGIPYGSHHSRPIGKDQLPEVLPCLLKGGIAK